MVSKSRKRNKVEDNKTFDELMSQLLSKNPSLAEKLHYKTTKVIAEYLDQTSSSLIYISTDSVFDGNKNNLQHTESYILFRTLPYFCDRGTRLLSVWQGKHLPGMDQIWIGDLFLIGFKDHRVGKAGTVGAPC